MTPELHTDADERQSIEQGGPPAEPPPATLPTPPADVVEARREAPPPATPPPTPTTPRGGIAASIQRMPLNWRWTLGLGLAFLSGLAAFEALFGGFTAVSLIVLLIVALALALAAGFVLSSWGAGLALLIAAAAGGLMGSWVNVQASPTGTVEGLTGTGAVFVLFFWFAFFCLAPLIVILLTGVGIGKWRGVTLGKSHARSVGDARVS